MSDWKICDSYQAFQKRNVWNTIWQGVIKWQNEIVDGNARLQPPVAASDTRLAI